VDRVSFTIAKGETLGVVGESGCGKSTTSRLIMQLIAPSEGKLIFDGQLVGPGGIGLREYRRQVQMVFQDSHASLNPRMTVGESIGFAPRVHGATAANAAATARELLAAVGLEPRQYAQRYPHELSGGQRQRVNIARALALRPRLLILDEPVSALDKSVEAQVLNLLSELKRQFGLTYLFISHDLGVVRWISDRVLVMYLGRIAELGQVNAVYDTPAHPYTSALLASRLTMDPDNRREEPPLTGDPPNPVNPPSGCRFRTRCALAEAACAETPPPLTELGPEHSAACVVAARRLAA
jgi:peptide/nickel transport system ATP-binding protein